jgi:poly-gamma-glutamate capsule biosynthesis protein CapA/YwtB (metallophosphatase superfamily)
MSPENAICLIAAEIDCSVLANDHVLDRRGRRGLVDTLQVLTRHRIRSAGAGHDLAQAGAPAILEVAGKGRVFVVGLAAAPFRGIGRQRATDLASICLTQAAADSGQKLQSARKPGDIVVVSIHWAQTGATKFRRNIAGSHTRLSTLQTSPSFTVTLPITP